MIKYISLASGIEAATVAWKPLGWKAAWYSEIAAFPNAVLKHHYPDTPNLGDMTKLNGDEYGSADLVVGGTPCQSFSVAGKRGGLDDSRGQLVWDFLRIADHSRAEWLVWENAPGVLSSNKGRDFAAFLGEVEKLGFQWAYRILDAQYFGVPQRRRRVFVVGYRGAGWNRAAAILFELSCLCGHPKKSKEMGQRITTSPEGIAGNVSSKWSKGTGGPAGDEAYNLIAHTLKGNGFDGSEEGTGRGVPLVTAPLTSNPYGDHKSRESMLIAYENHPQDSRITEADVLSLNAKAGTGGGNLPLLSFQAKASQTVRRLTPRECERLQGFPDDYTLVPYRGKPATDSPRYMALGNSMAVPVIQWIGERIQKVEEIIR